MGVFSKFKTKSLQENKEQLIDYLDVQTWGQKRYHKNDAW